jgi:hypothetical protein
VRAPLQLSHRGVGVLNLYMLEGTYKPVVATTPNWGLDGMGRTPNSIAGWVGKREKNVLLGVLTKSKLLLNRCSFRVQRIAFIS